MNLVAWTLVGLFLGILAKLLTSGKDPGGCILTLLIGVFGALLGGFLATLLGFGGLSGFDWRSLVAAGLTAVILLAIYRAMRK